MNSKLVLGTVQLGLSYGINNTNGKPSLAMAFKILSTAWDKGIRILDTAEVYGNSQEVIGEFHKANSDKIFKIITKLSAKHTLKNNELIKHISDNCKALNTSNLHGYMFHNYQSFKENTAFYNEVLQAKGQGLIKYVGISLYTNDEIEDIVANYSDFDFIQIPFNLFDNESKRKKSIISAKQKNIEIHVRSVFLQGLFFKDCKKLPEKLVPLKKYMETLAKIKQNSQMSTEALALQYVLQKEYIDYVLIGVENTEQLMNNITICENKQNIPHAVIDAIDVTEVNLLNPSNWN